MDRNRSVVLYSKNPVGLRLEDREIPLADPGSVVVKVLVCTLMGNSKRRLSTAQTPVPLVPGTSTVGRVFAIGPDTSSLVVDQLVLIDHLITARDDATKRFLFGREGLEGTNKLMEGPWRDATWAQYAKCPLENVFALDEQKLCCELGYKVLDLHWIETCAVAYAGLDDAGIQTGDRVVVAPSTGRYGAATLAVALTIGAQVVALGRNKSTLEALCNDFRCFSSLAMAVMEGHKEKDYQTLKSSLGLRKADIFVDLSPGRAGTGGSTPSHLSAGIRALRFGGTCCLMGGIAGEVLIPYQYIMSNNIKLIGRFRCERRHILQVIKMAESGKLPMGANIGMRNVGKYGLESIVDALGHAEAAYEASAWSEIVHVLPHM